MTDLPIVLRPPPTGECDAPTAESPTPARGAWPPARTMIRHPWVFATADDGERSVVAVDRLAA